MKKISEELNFFKFHLIKCDQKEAGIFYPILLSSEENIDKSLYELDFEDGVILYLEKIEEKNSENLKWVEIFEQENHKFKINFNSPYQTFEANPEYKNSLMIDGRLK